LDGALEDIARATFLSLRARKEQRAHHLAIRSRGKY
jgi:hypothetical protein